MVFGLVLIVGLALAGAAVWMVQGYVSQAQQDVVRERAARVALGELVEVFVTNKDLEYGAPLTKKDVQKVLFPKKALPENTFSDEAVLFPGEYQKPRFISRQVNKTELLLSTRVTAPGEDVGLTARLSKGKRAFAIRVDVASGVSGFVQTGDFVDVYWTGSSSETREEITQLIETTIKVVAVDQVANNDRSATAIIARTVTVEATPQQVARLAQAQSTGKLALSLVGTGDETIVTAVEVDQAALLGITQRVEVVEERVEAPRVCSIKTRRGSEVVEIPIPCTN
jgi:pilus assembly protein CpaB